ncbi:hypothetical protein [Nonomuraea sp. NPDC050643]|uniref:hypothetical protein n=1 Tax=Nonomuraea sp. NPDC050643 TaxID=3155660 RepID=UPI0033D4ACBB
MGERLAEATAGAVSQESAGRGTDLVPVLAAREQEVEQAVERMFPNLVSHAIRTSWDREGWAAGRTAAAAAAAAGRGHALGGASPTGSPSCARPRCSSCTRTRRR